ncbi:CoA transferase [Roseiarcaceae bacterium H3SJ34-1]|uniref:CaiB/BaiF CoA-transferase family protein n=1 Tax=Terripilifer ovatus TaxID=3032367 RepID=UPI003AB97F90|nr:CoA transferase [Roseiarcaceae bacterium H3SJ34-1]
MSQVKLSDCRVVDLCDHRGIAAGRMLADIGADVIRVEPPGGSPARRHGPFDDRGCSLLWECYAAGSRSIVIDTGTGRGLRDFDDLVSKADILIESGADAAATKRRYERLKEINPGLIYVAITPFGLDGPKSGYEDAEIVLWAAGGAMYGAQDGGRPPLRVSVPQAYLHAAADAAVGALIAREARKRSGKGQLVEISVQRSVAQATLSAILADAAGDVGFQEEIDASNRSDGSERLDLSGSGSATRRKKAWQVKDGVIELHLAMGPSTGRFTNNLFDWMRDEGHIAPDEIKWDWSSIHLLIESGKITSDDLEKAREVVASFLARHSRRELLETAIRRKLLIAPQYTPADLRESPQYQARGVFRAIRSSDGVERIVVGSPVKLDGESPPLTRAPGLGEHTAVILEEAKGRRRQARPAQAAALPFKDLRVLDLSWVVAGPAAGRVLSDFGATVVRVESAKRVDAARVIGPFTSGQRGLETSSVYHNCNAGKLSVSLDLANPEARTVLSDLIRWCDVIIESFSPGTIAKWGFGYQKIRDINPRAILVSSTLMGQSGPYSQLAGFGNLGSSISGVQRLVGWPDRPPRGPFGPYTDYIGPRFAIAGLAAALDTRERTGKGCWVDVSQAECGLFFLAPAIMADALSGEVTQARGNGDDSMVPHGVYAARETQDRRSRFVAVAVKDDECWRRLADLVGGAGLAQDRRFATVDLRRANLAALDAILSEWIGARTAGEAEDLLQARKVPAHVVAASRDVCEDRQLNYRNHFIALDHPVAGRSYVESSRYALSETPAPTPPPPPALGEHTNLVMRDMLGYDEAKVEKLRANKAFA